jgi:pimeloyl-ACP methyl ester carboxylesterase
MTTYVLIHGGGGVASSWDLVTAELRARGHDVVAVDLPIEDESAGLNEYADTVVEAIGDRTNLVVVAHSLGGFTGPLVCARCRSTCWCWWRGWSVVGGDGEGVVDQHRSRAGIARAGRERRRRDRRLLPRRPACAGGRGVVEGAGSGPHPDAGTVAAGCVAGRCDEVPAVSRRPHVPDRVDSLDGTGTPGHRPRRDRRRPLPFPQPPEGTGRPSGGIPCRAAEASG